MFIKNSTGKSLVVAIRNLEGYDDREDVLKPGEQSEWLNLEQDDTVTIEEVNSDVP